MNNISALSELRKKFSNKEIAKTCPKCDGILTIEKTQFFESELCEHCLDHAIVTSIDQCCQYPQLHKVKYIISNGTIQVRNQCVNCGYLDGKSIGGLTQAERESLPIMDEVRKAQRQENYETASHSFYNEVRRLRQVRFEKDREENSSEWWQQYNAYLRSDAWSRKRNLVLKRDQYRCQSCLTGLATQVHHKSYSFVDFKGNEPCFDLISICTPCHDLIHKK